MITFDEKIVGVWFLSTAVDQDWMAAITEIELGKVYELNYRFRYYHPESQNPWDEMDRKSWYKGVIQGPREFAIEGVRQVGKSMVNLGSVGELYEVLNNGDYAKFLEEFQAQPWVFSRQETGVEDDEEFEQFMKDIGADDNPTIQ